MIEDSPTLVEIFKDIFQEDFLNKALLLSIAGGAVTAVILYGKKFVGFIYERIRRRMVFSVKVEQTDDLFWQIETWLFRYYQKKYRNVIAYVGKIRVYSSEPKQENIESSSVTENKKENTKIKYRQEQDTVLILYKGSFIKILKGRDKIENANSLESLFFDSFYISTLFGASKIKSMLSDIVEYNQSLFSKEEKFYVYTFDGWNWLKQKSITSKTIDNVIMNEKIKREFIIDVDDFLKNKSWYKDRSIPYKRGYLFYGTPGNGKTSLALALSNYLKRDIYVMNISDISEDKGLIRGFGALENDSILLIEDLDTIFKTQRKIDKDQISFSTLLNCMDGVFFKEGVITVMTTNHKSVLDPALIRPGRIDLEIHFPNPEFDLVQEYINNFYKLNIPINGELNKKDHSMAEIQNICLKSTHETIKSNL